MQTRSWNNLYKLPWKETNQIIHKHFSPVYMNFSLTLVIDLAKRQFRLYVYNNDASTYVFVICNLPEKWSWYAQQVLPIDLTQI